MLEKMRFLILLLVPFMTNGAPGGEYVTSTSIPDEKWGYVTVRPHAHMFWWAYGALDRAQRNNLPLILWLQVRGCLFFFISHIYFFFKTKTASQYTLNLSKFSK